MYKTPRIRSIIIVYWFLLTYIVAALVWWFISLEQQNNKMTLLRLSEINKASVGYELQVAKIESDKKRKTAQYIGEGITFLALIFLGAIFVYRATRKQLRLTQQQHNFMMAVTHELKTPIAITRLNVETMQKHRLEENQQQKLIGSTLQEVNRLNLLCNNILLASQLDAGQHKFEKHDVQFSALVQKVVRDIGFRYPKRLVNHSIADGITVLGEELLLELLLSNLIENALKYSEKDVPVAVELSTLDATGSIVLKVKDEGPGIPPNEKKKVFDKFYRLGNEETRTAKGTGLGLYLCKQIAIDHHAAITVTDNANKGTVFTVTFKKI